MTCSFDYVSGITVIKCFFFVLETDHSKCVIITTFGIKFLVFFSFFFFVLSKTKKHIANFKLMNCTARF